MLGDLNLRRQAVLEESLKKMEADHGVLGECVIEHERTLAGVQVLHCCCVLREKQLMTLDHKFAVCRLGGKSVVMITEDPTTPGT